MPVAPNACNLLRISPAAFAVNVTAKISPGMNAPVRTWFAMRRVMVVVFPVPAPARMATGPVTASTASIWASFRPSKIGFSPIAATVEARCDSFVEAR